MRRNIVTHLSTGSNGSVHVPVSSENHGIQSLTYRYACCTNNKLQEEGREQKKQASLKLATVVFMIKKMIDDDKRCETSAFSAFSPTSLKMRFKEILVSPRSWSTMIHVEEESLLPVPEK